MGSKVRSLEYLGVFRHPLISLTVKNDGEWVSEKMGVHDLHPRSPSSLTSNRKWVSTVSPRKVDRKWVSTVSTVSPQSHSLHSLLPQSPQSSLHSLHSLYTTHDANFALLEAHCAKSARPNPPQSPFSLKIMGE
jgi:hypothetical protein